MIIEDIKNIKSSKAELRKFGITVGTVLGLLGGLFLWRGRDYYPWLFTGSAVILSGGLLRPALLKPLHKVWMTLALILGLVMTRVILCVLFYLVVSPLGLLLRLLGKDYLNLKFKCDNIDSYWIEKKQTHIEREDYERQF